jgi:hypothetical protein
MFLFIWDILFSPFGAQRRFTDGYLMVVLLFALRLGVETVRQRGGNVAPSAAMPSPPSYTQRAEYDAQPGFAEPPLPPWEKVSRRERAAAAGIDLAPRRKQRPRLKPWMIDADDTEPAIEIDEGSGFQEEPAEFEPSEDDDGQPIDRREPQAKSDLGAGGETIRAGFRRLRERRS